MKIYTKVIIDIASGEELYSSWFDYAGNLALCDAMSSGISAFGGGVFGQMGDPIKGEFHDIGDVSDESEKQMSPEEKEALRKYNKLLEVQTNFFKNQISEADATRELLKAFGPGNMDKIKGLLSGEEKLSGLSQEKLGELFNADPGVLESAMTRTLAGGRPSYLERATEQLGYAQAGRLGRAFGGDVSLRTQQAEQKEFEQFKEGMSRRGVQVTGTSYADATANSTPAIQALNERKQRWDIVKQQEREGTISSGTKNLLATTATLGGLESARSGQLISGAGLESSIQGQRYGQYSPFATGVPERRYGLLASTGLYGYPQAAGTFAGLAGASPGAQQPYQFYGGIRSREDIASAQNRTGLGQSFMNMFDFF